MNLLKSLFISGYLTWSMLVTGYAVLQLIQGEPPVAWIGVLLANGPMMLVIGWLMLLKNRARTSANFPLVNLLGGIGSGCALWAGYGEGLLIKALAVAGWGGFLLYVYWYSRLVRKSSEKLQIGMPLPAFNVKNGDGTLVSSSDFMGKPAILMFYRGNWCPLCVAQIKELVGHYQEISALGVRVALISPQPPGHTAVLAKRFGVDFEFLIDEGNAAASTLGINHPNGLPMGMELLGYDSDTVLPTVIITDRDGKMVWIHETDNYRIRPEPAVYLAVLRQHGVLPTTAYA